MNAKSINATIWVIPCIVAVLFAAVVLAEWKSIWGFHFYLYLPKFIGFGALTILCLTLVPPVASRFITGLEAASKALTRRPQMVSTAAIAVSLAMGVLFWNFAEALPLLGDGGLRAREVADGKLWQPTEAADFFLHALTYKFINQPLGLPLTAAWRIIASLAGVGFVWGTFRLATYLNARRALLWIAAMLSTGSVVLFFGYVESYSIVAAFIPWVMLSAVKAADGASSLSKFGAITILAALFHGIAAIIFLPAVALLILIQRESRLTWINRHLAALITGAAVLGLLMTVGSRLGWPFLSRWVVPIVAGERSALGLASWEWLGNIGNWTMLSGLVGIPVFVSLLLRPRVGDLSRRELTAITISASCLIFVCLFAPKLGGPIDWDLFSLPLTATVISCIVLLESTPLARVSTAIVPVTLAALINVGGFAAVNASVPRSVERFTDLIEVTDTSFHWLHWSSLVEHAEHNPELYARRNEFLMNAWHAPATNKRDSISTLLKLAETYIRTGDSLSARAAANLMSDIDSANTRVLTAQADVIDKFGSAQERRAFADRLAERFPDNPLALGSAGVLYLKLGDRDKCGEMLERSFALDDSNALTALNYGVFLVGGNRHNEALPVLKRSLELNPGSFLGAYYLATTYLALGDIDNAKVAMLRAEANALRPEEQERIKQLRLRP